MIVDKKIIVDYPSLVSYYLSTCRQRQVVKTRNRGLTNLDIESEVMCIEKTKGSGSNSCSDSDMPLIMLVIKTRIKKPYF